MCKIEWFSRRSNCFYKWLIILEGKDGFFKDFSKKQCNHQLPLSHAERELNHREQLIREKHQAVEEKLRSLYETNHRLKEAESVLRKFDETERILNAKLEDLTVREEAGI